MRQHLLGLTAEQQGAHAASTVGRHDDEITVSLRCNADNRLVRVSAVPGNRIAFDTGLCGRFCDDHEVVIVIRMLSGGLNELVLGVRDHFGAMRQDMEFRNDMEPRDLGTAFPRERHRHLDRGFGEDRPVNRHQQMLEHSFLSVDRPVRLDVVTGARRLSQAHLNQGCFFQYSQLYEARRVDYFCDKVPRADFTEIRYIRQASDAVPGSLRA